MGTYRVSTGEKRLVATIAQKRGVSVSKLVKIAVQESRKKRGVPQ